MLACYACRVGRCKRDMAEMCVKAVLAVADLERKDVNLDLIKVRPSCPMPLSQHVPQSVPKVSACQRAFSQNSRLQSQLICGKTGPSREHLSNLNHMSSTHQSRASPPCFLDASGCCVVGCQQAVMQQGAWLINNKNSWHHDGRAVRPCKERPGLDRLQV